jgi:hypothetical protein
MLPSSKESPSSIYYDTNSDAFTRYFLIALFASCSAQFCNLDCIGWLCRIGHVANNFFDLIIKECHKTNQFLIP